MRKGIVKLILAMAVAISLVPVASPAQASTCAVNNPEVEYLVCDAVVNPAMRVVCQVMTAAKLPCFM